MISLWPFAQWILDLIGPIPAGKGKFDHNKFRMFYTKFNINLCLASPAYPQSNGQVEAINKIIKRTLKTSLDRLKVVGQNLFPKFFGHTVLRIELQQEKLHSHLLLVQMQLSQLSLSKQHFESRTMCKGK
ncbi:hypothetical protein ACFX12_000403 [Malus domestica]